MNTDPHQRHCDHMPVVPDERDYGCWLDGSGNPQDLLKACHKEVLCNYPVSRQVNSVRNNDASLVVPMEPHLTLFDTTATVPSG